MQQQLEDLAEKDEDLEAEAYAKLNERRQSIKLHEVIKQNWAYLPDEFGKWPGCKCAINQSPTPPSKFSNLEQKLRQDETVAQPLEDLYRASPRPKTTRQPSDPAQIQRSQTLPTRSTETRNITQFLKAMGSWLGGVVVQGKQKGSPPNILEGQVKDRENNHEQPLSSQAHDMPSEEANSFENDDEDEPYPEGSGMYDLDLETK
jgi:hypothetical protein